MRGGERSARGFGSCPYLEGTLNNPAAAQLWGLSCVGLMTVNEGEKEGEPMVRKSYCRG